MFSVKDIALEIGFNINTLRYWLKKNNLDCMLNNYEFNLNDLFQQIKIYKKTTSRRNLFRKYSLAVILDLEEFKLEFFKYFNYVNSLKNRKRNAKTGWTISAIDCYNCKMECTKCQNKDICKNFISEDSLDPPMKKVVQKLLKDIGKPQK